MKLEIAAGLGLLGAALANGTGSDRSCVFEANLTNPPDSHPLVWPRREIVTRRNGVETRRYEPLPKFDPNIWDGHDLAVCVLESGSLIQGRNGPPIILEDLEGAGLIWGIEDNKARYLTQNGQYGYMREVDLLTGEVETMYSFLTYYGGGY